MNNDNKIEQIVTIYKNSFPMGWLDAFSWKKTDNKKSLVSVQEKISVFKKDVFDLFAYSVLMGEYIIKQGYFNSLESLQELLANGEILDDEKNKLRTVAVKSFNEMTYHLEGVISRFQHLMTMLNDKYGERQSKYVVNAYKLKHRGVRDENYGHFYDILIEVTYRPFPFIR